MLFGCFANQLHKKRKFNPHKNLRQLQFRIRRQNFNADFGFGFGFRHLIQQRTDQRLILGKPFQAHKRIAAAICRKNRR